MAGWLLKNVGTLTILDKGDLLNYVCMHRDPLSKINVLASARSSLHDQQMQYLLVVNSLHFIQWAQRVITADGVSIV